MIILQLNDVGMADELPSTPDGGKVLVFIDKQSGIQVIIPLGKNAVKTLSAQLSGLSVSPAISLPGLPNHHG